MTRNSDISNLWPDEEPYLPEGESQMTEATPPQLKKARSQAPVDRSTPVNKPSQNLNSQLGKKSTSGQEADKQLSKGKNKGTHSQSDKDKNKNKRLKFITSWPFLLSTGVIFFGGLGFMGVALLFKLPAVPNCPEIFWPTASASLRLYCAQLAANKETADNLLEAIALVNSLPADHPLRPEINRHIEDWSQDILDLGDDAFQAGKLQDAIALARKIPDNVPAYKLVEEKIQKWQSLWAQAEELYEKTGQELRQSNWNEAFRYAIKLTYLKNKYWATTKYDELVDLIQIAREESRKLDKAYQLKKTGRVANLIEAINLAQAIGSNSFAYKEAQDLIAECSDKLLTIARESLDKGDWRTVLEITKKTPSNLNLQEPLQDLSDLANAQSLADEGTAASFEEAIALAQKLPIGRPLYDKAQELISRWQQEAEGVALIQRARDLARTGSLNDLNAAIAEANLVPSQNPRYKEAQSQINRWISQIQVQEDRPYLERAEQLATLGDITSLQAAIEQANLVGRGRALYREAQGKIGRWASRIQRIQDQPFLDQAEGLAVAGNLPAAIEAAKQIKSGRTLYAVAQEKIEGWQREIRGQERLNEAYEIAKAETPEALIAAINLARRVPRSSSVSTNAREAANRWSYQLLSIAQNFSESDIPKAIELAKNIPPRTDAYQAAQAQIQVWEKMIQPPAPEPVPTTFPTE